MTSRAHCASRSRRRARRPRASTGGDPLRARRRPRSSRRTRPCRGDSGASRSELGDERSAGRRAWPYRARIASSAIASVVSRHVAALDAPCPRISVAAARRVAARRPASSSTWSGGRRRALRPGEAPRTMCGGWRSRSRPRARCELAAGRRPKSHLIVSRADTAVVVDGGHPRASRADDAEARDDAEAAVGRASTTC